MSRSTPRSALFDGILRLAAFGALTTTALLAPNAIQMFDAPVKKLMKNLDEEARKREIARALAYLRSRQLITEDYQHGIQVSKKALKRLAQQEIASMVLPTPEKWDHTWRIVFFDIPEEKKSLRDAFAAKIRALGFKTLQRSVFIYPHACRDEVTRLTAHYNITKFVTYIETSFIDNEKPLRLHFKNIV